MKEKLKNILDTFLVVSDNSASGAALVGRTEEQQKQYDFGRMVVLPDMVLTLAKNKMAHKLRPNVI